MNGLMPLMPQVVHVSVDDWAALYVNGKKEVEGHSVPLRDALIAIGLPLEEREFDGTALEEQMQYYGGRFPDNLSEVPATREDADAVPSPE